MELLTFSADTPAKALELAQERYGDDVLLVKTRQSKAQTSDAKPIYEVVVAVEEGRQENEQDTQALEDTSDISTCKSSSFEVSSEFSQVYKNLLKSEIAHEHLEKIVSLSLKFMPTSMRENLFAIERYFQILLKKMLKIKEETFTKDKQKVVMLVGPTGVGKTTTLAKLASRWAYLSKERYKVGIITLDTYRIGAVEQLFQYAKMMNLPMEDVVDVRDFERVLHSFSSCDIVLIDTVGSSPNDKEKISILHALLEQSSANINVSLVLSAGTKYEDLKNIYNNYSFLDIKDIIFTKFDETQKFGNVFSLLYECDKPLSYISVGQVVPDDLKKADGDFLISCLLGGFEEKNLG